MTYQRFIIPGEPLVKKNNRPIYKKGDKSFLGKSRKLADVEESMIWEMKMQNTLEFIKTPVNVCMHFYLGSKRRKDLSNMYQIVEDCLESAGIIENDSLIYGHDGSRKFYDKDYPRTEVIITDFYEDYSENMLAALKGLHVTQMQDGLAEAAVQNDLI